MVDEKWNKEVDHVRKQIDKIPEEATTTNCKELGLNPDNPEHRNVCRLNVSTLNAVAIALRKGDIHPSAAKFISTIAHISTGVIYGNGDVPNIDTLVEKHAKEKPATSVKVMTIKQGNTTEH
jgi:hypothetical protein